MSESHAHKLNRRIANAEPAELTEAVMAAGFDFAGGGISPGPNPADPDSDSSDLFLVRGFTDDGIDLGPYTQEEIDQVNAALAAFTPDPQYRRNARRRSLKAMADVGSFADDPIAKLLIEAMGDVLMARDQEVVAAIREIQDQLEITPKFRLQRTKNALLTAIKGIVDGKVDAGDLD